MTQPLERLRAYAKCSDCCDMLKGIADEIEQTYIEKPRNAEGELIEIGDTVYGKDGRAWRVCGYMPENTPYIISKQMFA